MGYIKLYNVFFTPAAAGNQTVRVEYRTALSTGAFTLVNNAAPVLANGDFSPIVTIVGLADGASYEVKATNLCNGSVTNKTFTAGQQCLGYTVKALIGGAMIEWVDCQTGAAMQEFLVGGTQNSYCSRTGVTSSSGEIVLIAELGACTS